MEHVVTSEDPQFSLKLGYTSVCLLLCVLACSMDFELSVSNSSLCACMSLQENLLHWLTDEKARDQFVIRSGSDTEVLWNDARHLKPEPVYKRQVSCYNTYLSSCCGLH